MRIITGTAKGRLLRTLAGDSVRPTAQRVKEALFSAIQFDIEGRVVLDLFAGSGQLGIEALSRGAKRAVFVDQAAQAVSIVKQNLETTGFTSLAEVFHVSYDAYLARTPERFDIVFLDPPYQAGVLCDAMEKTARVMRAHGILVAEHPAAAALPDTVADFRLRRSYKHGKVMISIYTRGPVDW